MSEFTAHYLMWQQPKEKKYKIAVDYISTKRPVQSPSLDDAVLAAEENMVQLQKENPGYHIKLSYVVPVKN